MSQKVLKLLSTTALHQLKINHEGIRTKIWADAEWSNWRGSKIIYQLILLGRDTKSGQNIEPLSIWKEGTSFDNLDFPIIPMPVVSEQ